MGNLFKRSSMESHLIIYSLWFPEQSWRIKRLKFCPVNLNEIYELFLINDTFQCIFYMQNITFEMCGNCGIRYVNI